MWDTREKFTRHLIAAVILSTILFVPAELYADKVCLRINPTTQRLQQGEVSTDNCRCGYVEIVDTIVLVGFKARAGQMARPGPTVRQAPMALMGELALRA
jgi:hypothetical protein